MTKTQAKHLIEGYIANLKVIFGDVTIGVIVANSAMNARRDVFDAVMFWTRNPDLFDDNECIAMGISGFN